MARKNVAIAAADYCDHVLSKHIMKCNDIDETYSIGAAKVD